MTTNNEVGVEGITATLAAGFSATDSSFTVESGGSAFPASAFQVLIDNEVILVGSRSGNVFSSLSRGQEGTAAAPHSGQTGIAYVVGGAAIAEGGGGGSQPHKQQGLHGGAVAVANGASGALSITASDFGDDLVDFSTPDAPTMKATGSYVFTVSYDGEQMTAAGFYIANFEVDTAGVDNYFSVTSGLSKAGSTNVFVTLTTAWYMTAGMGIALSVKNLDGVQDINFVPYLFVQQVG